MDGQGRYRNSFRYPLDSVLGSEAQVRLLRVLLVHRSEPLSVPDSARLAGLTPAGARRALDRLRTAGFVRRIGSGRVPTFSVREDAAGIRRLAQAFEEEQARYERFIALFKAAVSWPEVVAAWLEELPSSPSDAVQVRVVADVRSIPWIQDELRARLIVLEHEFDIIIEAEVHTRADAPAPPDGGVVLWGLAPQSDTEQPPSAATHAEVMHRELMMSKAIADLVRRDATLIDRARRHVVRLLGEDQGTAGSDLLEWRQLLESYSADRIADLLGSESSRAERLRQSSPFFAVLSSGERRTILQRMMEGS